MRILAEEGNIFPQIIPVDLAGGANAAVGRIDTKNYSNFSLCIVKNAGAANEPIVATLSQHDVATAGTPKELDIKHGVYVKAHANIEDATAFAKEDHDAAPNEHIYTGTSSVQKEAFIEIPIAAADLDQENGYRWFSVAIADTGVGGACIGAAFVLAWNPRYTPPPDAV